MSDEQTPESVDLTDFSDSQDQPDKTQSASPARDESSDFPSDDTQRTAAELEAVFDIPVNIQAVLGRTNMEVSELLDLESGDVVELDRKVGEAIDIYVNNRLVARGEVVLVDERLGITMTEIIKSDRTS